MDLSHWITPQARNRAYAELTVSGNPAGIEEELWHCLGSVGEILIRVKEQFGEVRQVVGWLEALAACLPEGDDCPSVWLDGEVFEPAMRTLLEAEPMRKGLRLFIRSCASVEEARAMASHSDALGVYRVRRAEGRRLESCEIWDGVCEPQEGESFLAAMLVSACGSCTLDAADLLNGEWGELFAEQAIDLIDKGSADLRGLLNGISIALPSCGLSDSITWSPALPNLYAKKWGEDLRSHLPLLWFDAPGAERFRWRFRTLVSALFRENFLLPCMKGLGERSLDMSLRFPERSALADQAASDWGLWGNVAEGIGALALEIARGEGRSLIRQAASVARQNESALSVRLKPLIGKNISIAQMRAALDETMALGAQRVDAGLRAPQVAAGAKRSGNYLPLSDHPDMARFVDYQARLGDLLAQNSKWTEVLVLAPSQAIIGQTPQSLPAELAESEKRKMSPAESEETERQFRVILDSLDALQVECEIVDEESLVRLGKPLTNTFWVGPRAYSLVIVPPAPSWRKETVQALRRFARRGGSLILTRPIAPQIDFEDSTDLAELETDFQNVYVIDKAGRAIGHLINRLEPPHLVLKEMGDKSLEPVRTHRRYSSNGEAFFVANTSGADELELRVTSAASGVVRVLEPWAPRITLAASDDRLTESFNYTMPAGTSALLALGGEADPTEPPPAAATPGHLMPAALLRVAIRAHRPQPVAPAHVPGECWGGGARRTHGRRFVKG